MVERSAQVWVAQIRVCLVNPALSLVPYCAQEDLLVLLVSKT